MLTNTNLTNHCANVSLVVVLCGKDDLVCVAKIASEFGQHATVRVLLQLLTLRPELHRG